MYLKMAEEEDKKMTERWEADADGILIFVSTTVVLSISLRALTALFQDWSVLCRCSCVGRGICPGSQAEFAGHLRILSRKYIPGSRRSQYTIYYTTHSG